MKTTFLITLGLLVSSVTVPAQFNSGSTGTNELNVSADTTLDLPPSGVLNYTTITVMSNATLRFNRNSNNTPVHLLATGDVSIAGTIDVSGGNATTAAPFEPGKGGPGGFAGGWPGDGGVPAGDGYGPGGGKAGIGTPNAGQNTPTGAGAGSYYSQAIGYNNNNLLGYRSDGKGATYGSELLVPLLGGSGGGGIGSSASVTIGRGGGGGGGAILIASTTRIVVTGAIRADGGDGQTFLAGDSSGVLRVQHLNPGSGGGIRLVAPLVEGTGLLSAFGPVRGNANTNNLSYNYGRVRIDSIDRRNLSLLSVDAARSVGNFMVVFPSNRLDVINVAGTAIAEGSVPVTIQLPNGSPTNQTVIVQARNFNSTDLPIQIAVAPQNGPTVLYNTNINNSALNPATVTVNVTIPVSTPVTVSAWTRVP